MVKGSHGSGKELAFDSRFWPRECDMECSGVNCAS